MPDRRLDGVHGNLSRQGGGERPVWAGKYSRSESTAASRNSAVAGARASVRAPRPRLMSWLISASVMAM